jgi:hypothetical protein
LKKYEKVLLSILTEEPEPIHNIAPSVPRELCTIVEKAIAKKPFERYQHVHDLLRDLDGFVASQENRSSERPQRREGTTHPPAEKFPPTNLDLEADLQETLALLEAGRRAANQEPDVPPESDESAGREESRAESLYQEAASLFSRGDTGGCLRRLGDALRLDPNHTAALNLAERLREVVVEMVDQEDALLRNQILAALPSESPDDDSVSTPSSISDEAASLGNFLLSEQGPFAGLSKSPKDAALHEKSPPAHCESGN